MKNCLHAFTKWIFCLLAMMTINDLTAQNVRDGFCDHAIKASCGVAITNQTNKGGPNLLWDYQCNDYTFSGPERVYKITTTEAGTIQIDLSIKEANIDLDVLLLSDNCNTPTCIGQAITSNANGKTELLLYNNAPAGTYYVVVDSEVHVGTYDLLITCTPTVGCNLEYEVTPKPISCGADKGAIDVAIAWGKAPFTIAWDNADNTVWNTYTTSDKNYTIDNLPAGVYVVKVTDAMGCELMKNNIVVTKSGTSLDATFSTTDAPCGSDFGWINVDVANSSPPYWVTVTGPRNGTVQATSNSIVIKDMPPGNYEVTVEKGGCTKEGWVTVGSTADLDFVTEVTNASCGGKGSFWVTIDGGSPTYTLEWWHEDGTSNWSQVSGRSFPLNEMKAGEYTIKITDKNGCTKTKKVTMGGGTLDFALESNAATCGDKGSVWVTITTGTKGFVVEWTGPTSGWKNTNEKSFAIDDLVAGNYEINIKDSKGCQNTKWVTVANSGGVLDFELEANSASCGEKGAIWVTVKNGNPTYTVEWWGPNTSKWATTELKSFQLKDLAAGDYTVKITDSKGCSNTKTIKINTTGNGLDLALESLGVRCGALASLWIEVKNGTSKYGVDVTGPGVNKWFEASSPKIQVTDLPAGHFTVKVTDANGCTGTETITIEDKGGNLDVALETTDASCGGKGSSWVTIKNGAAKFVIELWGPNNTTFWAETNSASFKLSDLSAGDYTLKITDKNGCSTLETFNIGAENSNMSMALEVNNAGCEDNGRIWVTINGGTAGYNLKWDGPSSGEANTATTGYQINNLKAGEYTLTVKDYYGCSYTKTVTVYGAGNNLTLALESNNATCSQNGYLWADVKNGVGPYQISWTGAATGSMNVSNAGFQISNLPAGDYWVSAKDKNGCSTTQEVTIGNSGSDIAVDLEVNNGSCGSNGYVWVTITNGDGPYYISWTGPKSGEVNSGSNGYQISDLPKGWYKVTVKDKDGCKVVKDIEVLGGGVYTVTTQQTNATCGKNGEVWVDMNGGVAPFNISLTGPVIGHTSTNGYNYHFPSVPPGTYTLSLEDATGCVVNKELTITNSGGNLNASVETTNAICNQGGAAWITINGNTAPYTINWTGPVTGSYISSDPGYQIKNLSAGDYTISVKDNYGCYTNKSITIINTGNSLNLSLEATNASCGQKGAIWTTITGGKADYTIEWTGPSSGYLQTSNTGNRISNLVAGTYSVKVTDKNNCATTVSITVGSNVQDFTISTESTDAICGQKGWAWITMNGGSPNYNISWSGPISGSASTSQSGYRLDDLVAGTYTITVKEYSGCEAIKTITILDKGSDISLALEASSATCGSKGSIWATISGGTAGYSYSWTGPSTGSVSTSQTAYKIDNLTAGTYTVTVRDSKGCETVKSITVGNDVQNFTISTESTNAICGQKGWAWITMNGGSANYAISWTGPLTGSVNTSEAGYRLDNLVAGTYTVTVKDGKGCEDTETIIIIDNGSDINLTLEATNATCTGKGSIWATINGGTAGYSYSWTGPSTGSISTSQTAYKIDNLTAGTYTVTVRDSKGCETVKSISVGNDVQNFTISTESTNAICGQKGWAWITMNGGSANYAISWTGPLTGSVNTSEAGYRLDNLVAGTYTVTVKDGKGCEDTETIIIIDNGSDINLTLEATNATCTGKGSIWATISGGTAGYSYSWTGPSTGSISTSQTAYKIDNLTAGTYTVTVRDSKGCETVKSITVGNDVQNFTISTESSNGTCGQKGWTYITMNGGSANYTITWSGPLSGTINSIAGYRLDNLVAGTYTITVKDAKGCEDTKTVIIIDEGSDITLTLEATSATCDDKGSIWATISGGTAGYSYSWTGPATGSVSTSQTGYKIEALSAGTYTITVRDSKGCETVKSVTVGNDVQNFTISTESTNATCGQKGWAYITMNGGSPNYTITWSGPLTGSATSTTSGYRLDNLVAGTYTITVKDAKGCEDTKTVIIIDEGSDITLALEATNATCNGKGVIDATISGGTAGYSYSWTGPVTGSVSTSATAYRIEDLPKGTYTVTVRDSKGCETTHSITIQSIGGNLTVNLTTATSVACEHDGTTQVSIGGGKAPYTITYVGVTTGTVTATSDDYQLNLFPGDYNIFVKDSNGCEGSQKIKINNNGSDLAIDLTATGADCDNQGMLLVNITGGISNYMINWVGNGLDETITTGNKSFALTDLAAGTYEVKVIDGIGCVVTKSVTISNLGGNLGLQLIPKNGTCGQAGAIDVNISGGAATYTITWSGPSSGSATSSNTEYQISGLGVGSYAVTVKDANGCEIKETVAINAGSAVDFNLTATDTECNKNGNILVDITKGAPNYVISWTGPSSGTETVSANVYRIEGLIAGTYNITIKDANGCESAKSVDVGAAGSSLGLTLTNTNASCSVNGSITATVTNGEGDYTFSWTETGSGSGLGSTKVSDSTYFIDDLPTGSYTVSVIDKNGCSISKIININAAANELSLNVVGKNASCGQASSIQVTIANGVPDFKIEWSGANTGTFNTSANSYTITNVTNGETVVRVTDAAGCSKAQVVVIDANPNDVNFTYQSKDASCNNKGAIWLTISDGTAPYNIAWTGPSSGASVSADEAVQITDLDAGVYNVTVSDKSNCMITQTIEVKNAGGGIATNFSHKAGAVTCNVSGSVLVTMISGVAPFTVTWSGPTNGSRTASTTDIKIEDLVVGAYQVTVTSANGCGVATQNVIIEDKRVVLGISGTVTNGVCGGKGTVALSWSGDRDPYTISWTGTSIGSIATNDLSRAITDLKDGSYTFTVTGFDGCTGQYQATISNGGNSTSADFTYAISAKQLTFSNLSSTGAYAWDFGDGVTSTETNPIHTYEKNGTYTICLKVTNDCGVKEKCQTVTINAFTSDNGIASAKVVLAEQSGPKGTVLQLPVRVENCTRIGTLSGTINLGNNQVAQINGLSPNAISPVYNEANHSFSYLASGTGMNITGETILFYINVQLTGSIGESSTVDLSSLPVALELTCTEDGFTAPITPEVGSGRVSISTNASVLTEVGGNILTYWGDGVADAMVTIRSTDHEMNSMTSLDGDYTAEAVPMGYEYEFKPSKTTNPANGLSTFGLFLTQKYILGYHPEQIQSPYQVVAMDANCSGSLTTFDLFAMQQMLVGNLTEFPGCESWVFVDANHEFPTEFTNKNVFPYPSSHTMMLEQEDAVADFIGIKVGDVLGRALPNDNSFNTQATDRNRKVMPLQISAKEAAAGEIVEVHFQAQDFTEMVSFQLGLDFDPTILELVEFVPNVHNALSSALSGGNRNHLNISWFDPAGKGIVLVENEDLFTVKFVAKQKITNTMELFTINNRTFVSELHQQSNEAYRFKLVNKSPTNSTFKVYQNTPNPFMDATTITIDMPTALDAIIVLHDQFGRTIQTIQQPFNQGVNKVNINRNQLSAGIYYYTVKVGEFAATKRMLIIE